MVKMTFTPNQNNGIYTEKEVSFNLPNNCGLDDYFRVFKSFAFALGFEDIGEYELKKEIYPK